MSTIVYVAMLAVAVLVVAGFMFRDKAGLPPPVGPKPAPVPHTHPVMPHILLYGPPGTGKTALAVCVANELMLKYGRYIRVHMYTPSTLKTSDDITAMVSRMEYGDVVFIDEVHGLAQEIEESLYSVVQNFVYGDREGVEVKVPRFTMIGATTLLGNMNKPFIDRFNIVLELDPLDCHQMIEVIEAQHQGWVEPRLLPEYRGQETAKVMIAMHMAAMDAPREQVLSTEVVEMAATRALGVPRIGKQFSVHLRAAQAMVGEPLTVDSAVEVFNMLGVDKNGLHKPDRRVIKALIDRGNQPIGAAALASVAKVSRPDLELIVERRLDECGMLERTPRGRKLTQKALTEYS